MTSEVLVPDANPSFHGLHKGFLAHDQLVQRRLDTFPLTVQGI